MLRFATDGVLESELGMRNIWHRSELKRAVEELMKQRGGAGGDASAAAAGEGGKGAGIKRKRDDDECCICNDAPAVVAVVPCGHCCLCETCATKLKLGSSPARCPMCRNNLQNTLRVYMMAGH
eukprot:SAG31_NODE_4331_length_3346_cov_1.723745_3_plen_123_part_00